MSFSLSHAVLEDITQEGRNKSHRHCSNHKKTNYFNQLTYFYEYIRGFRVDIPTTGIIAPTPKIVAKGHDSNSNAATVCCGQLSASTRACCIRPFVESAMGKDATQRHISAIAICTRIFPILALLYVHVIHHLMAWRKLTSLYTSMVVVVTLNETILYFADTSSLLANWIPFALHCPPRTRTPAVCQRAS